MTVDHLTVMRGRLIEQYKGLSNLDKDLQVAATQLQEMEAGFQSLIDDAPLSTATGVVLDRWGVILNTARFGLSDDEYRGLLYIRIAQYHSEGTPEDMIQIARLLFQTDRVKFSEPWPPAKFLLEVEDPDPVVADLTFLKQAIVNAKPAGVQPWVLLMPIPAFAFFEDNDPDTDGFADGISHAVVYSENFSTGTIGETLADFGFSLMAYLNPMYLVEAMFGGMSAYLKQNNAGNHAAMIYTTRTFDATVYFSYKARIRKSGSGPSLVWDLQATTLDHTTRIGCYTAGVDFLGNIYLGKDWAGGAGSYYVLLDSAGFPGWANPLDYVMEVVQQGSTLEVFVDGISVLSAVDADYSSGYIGLQAYNEGYFSELEVQEYPDPDTAGGIFSYFI